MIDLRDYRQFRDSSYYVSSEGKVIRKLKNGKITELKCTLAREGKYKRYRIYITDYKIKISLARVVYETFRGEIPEGYVVAHRNGCSTMNDLANLYLVKVNACGRYRNLQSTTRKVINLNNGRIYIGLKEASKQLKYSRDTISQICEGKPKKIKLNIAWYDDVNSKAFRGNYQRHHDKYMIERV